MTAEALVKWFRRFLWTLSGLIFAGTAVELWFTEHLESTVQLLPFVLCAIGVAVVLAAVLRPRRGVLLVSRVVMGLIVLGSLYGVYSHVAHNLAFEREIRPSATTGQVFMEALYGASPLLAPGALALGALLALAATYYHPLLTASRNAQAG